MLASCTIQSTAGSVPLGTNGAKFGKSQKVAPNDEIGALPVIGAARKTERKGGAPPPNKNFMTREDISEFQREKISELRKSVGAALLARTPIFDDDFSMLRWLIGYNYKIEEILPKFEKASHILNAMNLSNLIIEDIDQINAYLSTVTKTAKYFPGGIMGFDAEGNCIAMQMDGQCHPKTLCYCGQISDMFRLTITETALIYQLIRIQERRTGQKLGLRIIIDLDGFNSDHITNSGLKAYASALKYLQNLFPDIARQVFVINAPMMVTAVYKIIKSVLSEQSRQKVVFLGADYQETLLREFGADYLYERWGGNVRPTCGDPKTGTLRVGGQPPLAMKYCAENNPEHVDDNALVVLAVPARGRREISVNVSKPGARIHWYFTASSDIEFGIFKSDGIEAWPQFRVATDFVPEYGSVECSRADVYTLVFDNTFSKFFAKEIRFHVHVK